MILGDQSCVRERVTVGDDVVLGRGSLIENDTTVGAMTKIQADAYITAYSTLEEEVFIAPCVVTTNDNFMGRTEKRHALIKGPTIRRGARVGGGAILCPASRSARRRSSAQVRSSRRTSPREPWSSAAPHACSATCPTRSASRRSTRRAAPRVGPWRHRPSGPAG